MKKVRDCMESISKSFDSVAPHTPVEDLIQAVSRDASSRSVFVTDEGGGLLGIVHVREILRMLGAQHTDHGGFGSPLQVMARRASDIMGPAYSVSPDDDLGVALKLAVQSEVYDIPVVENGKVVANLDCLELIVNLRPGA